MQYYRHYQFQNIVGIVTLCLSISGGVALAQANNTVKIVVPYAPGE
jgi:hypothetical protein